MGANGVVGCCCDRVNCCFYANPGDCAQNMALSCAVLSPADCAAQGGRIGSFNPGPPGNPNCGVAPLNQVCPDLPGAGNCGCPDAQCPPPFMTVTAATDYVLCSVDLPFCAGLNLFVCNDILAVVRAYQSLSYTIPRQAGTGCSYFKQFPGSTIFPHNPCFDEPACVQQGVCESTGAQTYAINVSGSVSGNEQGIILLSGSVGFANVSGGYNCSWLAPGNTWDASSLGSVSQTTSAAFPCHGEVFHSADAPQCGELRCGGIPQGQSGRRFFPCPFGARATL